MTEDTEHRKNLASLRADAAEFQVKRLDLLAAGDAPTAVSSDKLVCVHVVPFDAIAGATTLDVGRLDSQCTFPAPIGSTGRDRLLNSFNTDGLLRSALESDNSTSGFLQFFRNGTIETVDSRMMVGRGREDGLPSPYFCKTLVTFLDGTCRLYEELQIRPPISVLIALLGVKGSDLLIPAPEFGGDARYGKVFNQDRIVLPPVQLVDLKADVRPLLRISLDALWQAAGEQTCSCYDVNGKWNTGG